MSSTRTRRDAACHASCQSGVAFPSFPAAKLRQKAESRCIHKRAKPTIFTEIAAPAIREGRDTRVFSFPARIWDKNRAAIPSQRRFGTRIVPRYLPSEVLGQESRRDTFPAKIWDKNRAAIPSQRSFGTRIVPRYLPSEVLGQESRRDTFPAKIWDKNRAAIPSQRSFGTRIVPRYLPSEVLGQESCRDTFPAKFWDKNRAAIPSQRSFGTRIARFPTFFRRRASAIQRFFVYSRMTRAENERYRQV